MLHLDLPDDAAIARLASARADACVSIFVPTTPQTQHVGAARLELKNLAKDALAQLDSASFDKRRRALIDDKLGALQADDDFWAHQATSLAVFATPDEITTFRLPTHLRSQVEVADRFHVKPLFRARAFPDLAVILALAENAARVVEMRGEGPADVVRVPDLPKNIDAAGAKRKSRDTRPGGRFEGSKGERFHRVRFAEAIDAALAAFLAGREVPLVLAGVAEFEAIYREVNTYPHLAPKAVHGNPEHMTPGELAEAARPVLRDLHRERIEGWRSLYANRFGERRASSDLAQVARAAVAGAVELLMVDIDAVVLGTMDPETGAVAFAEKPGPATYDVVDEVAAAVLATGGKVVGVRRDDLPEPNAPLAAVLRYAA
jgi:hypothetical protein